MCGKTKRVNKRQCESHMNEDANAESAMSASADAAPFAYELRVRLPSARVARIVADALAPDDELKPALCARTVTLEAASAESDVCDRLRVCYRATQLKTLRVAVRGFCDMLDLALRTVRDFDEGSGDGE